MSQSSRYGPTGKGRGKGPQRPWSEQDYETARTMRESGCEFAEIGAHLGRTWGSVAGKLVTRKLRTISGTAAPKPGMIEERDRRVEAATQQSTTGKICGDPAPGFSALDRRAT